LSTENSYPSSLPETGKENYRQQAEYKTADTVQAQAVIIAGVFTIHGK
jgi:hypothetical protein